MRFAEMEGFRISLFGQTVHNRASGITESHYFRTFIERLSRSIIDCLTYHRHIFVAVHPYDLRVSARHQQADKRECRLAVFFAFHSDKMGHHIRLQMIYIDQRYIERRGKTLGKRGPDQ